MGNIEQPIMVMTDEDSTECAWCLRHKGKPQGEGSHGICEVHAGLQYTRYQLSKQPSALNEGAKQQKKRSFW